MNPKNLTDAIKIAKKSTGVLSKTLIHDSGVNKTRFYRIINGELSPSIETKSRIAKSLGIDLETFDSLFKSSASEIEMLPDPTKRKKMSLILLSALLSSVIVSITLVALTLKNMYSSDIRTLERSIADAQDDTLFIEDVTVPDGSSFVVNTKFDKTWRVKNTGSVVWKDRYLMRVTPQSDLICSSPDFVPISETKPGHTVDITVTFTAPRVPGSCLTVWKSADKLGNLHFPDMHGLFSVVKVIEEQN